MSSEIRKIESIHYRCLRLIIKDYRQRVPRKWVTASTQRLPPKQWGKFAAASLDMKICQTGVPERIYEDMFKTPTPSTGNQVNFLGSTRQRLLLEEQFQGTG